MRTGLALILVFALVGRAVAEGASGWRHAAIPGFDLYSDLSDADAQHLLHDFVVLHRDARLMWPLPQLGSGGPSGLILLCNQRSEFDRLNPRAGPSAIHYDRDLVINFNWRLQSQVTADGYPRFADFFGGATLQSYYSGWFISLIGERVPPWLQQGLGKLLEGMCCTDDTIEFPPLSSDPTLAIRKRTGGSEESLRQALAIGAFLTLEQLFATTTPPPPNKPTVVRGRNGRYLIGPNHRDFWPTLAFGAFIDESYEFAQFCLFAEHGKYRQAFMKFALAAANGPWDEAGFQKTFGTDYHTMLLALWRYTSIGDDQAYRLTPDTQAPVPALDFHPADPRALAAAEARWLKGAEDAPPDPTPVPPPSLSPSPP